MGKVIDLKGQIFGHLLVIRQKGINNQNRAMWLCKCSCGIEKKISSHDLKHHTISCGHIAKEVRIKNMALGRGWNKKEIPSNKKRLHKTWDSMCQRCRNKNNLSYKNYGGRGIEMCEEWNSFITFEKWALETGYNDTLTIDRINNNGNYEPGNCRWATMKQQSNNKRSNIIVKINGTSKNITQWCELYNIKWTTFKARLIAGKKGLELIKKVGEY